MRARGVRVVGAEGLRVTRGWLRVGLAEPMRPWRTMSMSGIDSSWNSTMAAMSSESKPR